MTLETLKAISHPIRISIIRILKTQTSNFSRLMSACGLDPNFDTGQFCYHLSELVKQGIVAKEEEHYCLTDFGHAVFKVLKMIDAECSMFSKKIIKSEEEVKELEGLTTRWGRTEDFEEPVAKRNEDKIPSEKRMKTEKFKEWIVRKRPHLYLAEKDGKKLGELRLNFEPQNVIELIKIDEEKILRIVNTIYLVGALTLNEDRETVVKAMLDKFIVEAKENGAEAIRVDVDVEDQAYINALEDSGFEKRGTAHLMLKIIE